MERIKEINKKIKLAKEISTIFNEIRFKINSKVKKKWMNIS